MTSDADLKQDASYVEVTALPNLEQTFLTLDLLKWAQQGLEGGCPILKSCPEYENSFYSLPKLPPLTER